MAQPSHGAMVLTLLPNARSGDPAKAAAIISAVPDTGVLVDVRTLGLHRLIDYDEAQSVIIALVSDHTAYTPVVTVGGLDINGSYTAVEANVVSEGLQWLKITHNHAQNAHDVFILVQGRLRSS